MIYELTNEKIKIAADTFGSELHSVSADGKKYSYAYTIIVD